MKQPLGVLLLHGFTGLPETVQGLVPHLEGAVLPYRMPALRGHWTRPEDLVGVTYQDWVADASRALDELLTEVDRAIVVGLSMGGLVTLQLAMDRPGDLAGVVTVAAALRFKDPLTALSPVLSRVAKFWPTPKAPKDCAYGEGKNYPLFPTKTFVSLQEFARRVEGSLARVDVPLLVLHSRADRVITPISAQIIFDRVASKDKELQWFERSGHEMMLDWEKDQVFERIMGFIQARRPA